MIYLSTLALLGINVAQFIYFRNKILNIKAPQTTVPDIPQGTRSTWSILYGNK